ncbi:MAG: NAD(P)-dependent glycerol-3-phosphate dehydrogenase [Eubacterium sp.]|nr:NAD(P)-dependent glycerol-3-phosphate dehydrogenase [Eubacterium sp.]MBR3173463.1 NAD(P)-dependent glycerol-3-phosphate dehydrogenase [Eubacterium sp.]
MSKVTVLGGGGWAIALAMVLCENGNDVTIWSAVDREVESLSKDRENKISLPGIIIPDELKVTGDLDEAIKDVDVIVMAVASSFVRPTAHSLQGKIKEGQIIVDVAKGIEDDTYKTMTEILVDELPDCDPVVLSGPSHAEEVARQIPTSVVIGSKNEDTAEFVQKLFANEYFRVYRSPDMKSIELGGALKNVIALAAGVIDGLGFGDNTEAALMTRGISEITRLGDAMGGHKRTFYGLSGMGDLIVTCASKHSRNRRAGVLIGKGYTLDEAIKEVNMVVEGAVSAKAAYELTQKYNVDAPIIKAVNKVLFEGMEPLDAMKYLMNRRLTNEYIDLDWEDDE